MQVMSPAGLKTCTQNLSGFQFPSDPAFVFEEATRLALRPEWFSRWAATRQWCRDRWAGVFGERRGWSFNFLPRISKPLLGCERAPGAPGLSRCRTSRRTSRRTPSSTRWLPALNPVSLLLAPHPGRCTRNSRLLHTLKIFDPRPRRNDLQPAGVSSLDACMDASHQVPVPGAALLLHMVLLRGRAAR